MESFYVRLEPVDSNIPPFTAKATKIEQPGGPPGGPVDPGYSPPWAQVPEVPTHPIVLPPVEPPPTPPDVKIVWLYSLTYNRWMYTLQPASGAIPKGEDECQPPSPPGYYFTWGFSPQLNGWIAGYAAQPGAAGPK